MFSWRHAVYSDPQSGVCVFTTVGVSAAVGLLFGTGGFILGMIAGACRASQQSQNSTPPTQTTREIQGSGSPQGVPLYEEIELDEMRVISLTGNAAYGCKTLIP